MHSYEIWKSTRQHTQRLMENIKLGIDLKERSLYGSKNRICSKVLKWLKD